MKKNNFPLIVVVIVIILLIIGFLMKGKKTNLPTSTSKTEVKESNSLTGKLEDFLLSGKSVKCVYEKDKDNITTIYVKGKNFYGEFLAAGKKGYMIYKNNCSWIWSEGEKQGVKMCYKEDTSKTFDITKNNNNLPKDVNYSCQPLIGGDDKLNPPADINFMDLSKFVKPS
jgi:hypothetical protein